MKTAIIFTDDVKQVILTPETDVERQILKIISEDNVEIRRGTLHSTDGFNIGMCMGEYLRAFQDTESTMLVIKSKEEK